MERLSSWKDIANYLGVTVRTAQKWELERGLPVSRLPGARGPVSALVSDIEAWRKQAEPAAPVIPLRDLGPRQLHNASIVFLAALGFIVAGISWVKLVTPKGALSTFRIEQKVLSAYDDKGVFLWKYAFEKPVSNRTLNRLGKLAWIGDLFADGHKELLLAYQAESDAPRKSVLYCFAEDGHILWTFVPGREVKTAEEEFDPSYLIDQFLVLPKANENVIVVSSIHQLYYPTQVAALNSHGKLMGEYWHSGHLGEISANGFRDGPPQRVYLAGINNELRAGTLVVLDLASLQGITTSSHSDLKYQLQLPLGHEHARLIFQRSCINKEFESFNKVSGLVFGQEVLTLSTVEVFSGERSSGTIMYEFDRNLKLKSAAPIDKFAIIHRQLEAEGLLKHKLSPAELASFRNVQYLPPSDALITSAHPGPMFKIP